ncbi:MULTISPECIES: DUF4160 domain-containing protein [Xanthomonas]|uniref:DUF4160 domain-containing protein n=1 Tax=Xanthomonas TaxID=338 RepID=UPI000F8D6A0C|nr:DUF4160 domain-containing protein [Xanthomonas arboricola]MBB4767745.1 hypothetical protein [Xanthomonas arboricola]
MTKWIVDVPDDLAASLKWSLDQGSKYDDEEAEELRALGVRVEPGMRNLFEHMVRTNNKFKVEIFSNEHPPPHFHVSYSGESNCFRIDNGEPLYEKGLNKFWPNIREWYSINKISLVNTWNKTRPANCPVGEIKA